LGKPTKTSGVSQSLKTTIITLDFILRSELKKKKPIAKRMSRDDVVGMGDDAPEGARVASHTVDSPGCACFKCCHCVCTRRPGLSPPPMLQSRRGAEDRAGRRFATYAIRPSHGFGLCNAIYLTRTITRHKTYSATYAEDRTDHGTRLSAIGVSITGMEPKSKSRTTARHTPPLSPEKL
jgi:hypothetical protein